MTDLSKMTIKELRGLQMKLADGEFPDFIETGMEAFDELADRYRRLEEAQGAIAVSEEDKELPGSLELAIAIQNGQWPHTMDAQAWATAWMLQLKETPEIYKDEGAMIGWFANAIMAGYDTAIERYTEGEGK